MKRILGIILAVLSAIAFFAFLVLACLAKGLTLGAAILHILLATAIVFAMMGLVYLILWLLD